MILKLILWCMMGYSITQIITQTKIFKPIRELLNLQIWRYFWGCVICVGVWVGFGMGWLFWSPTRIIFNLTDVQYIFFDGMLCSVISWFIYLFEEKYG